MKSCKYNKNLTLFHLHKFFTRFSLDIFFAFGALVLYSITNSIYVTLAFLLIQYLSIILFNSLLLQTTLGIINKWDIKFVMFFGLIIFGASFIIIPNLNSASQYFNITLLFISILAGFGANLYYMPADLIRLNYIGCSKNPGLSASFFSSNAILAGLSASLITLYINKTASITILFTLAGLSFISSFSFLHFVKLNFKKYFTTFGKYIKKLKFREHVACMEFNHELYNIGVPFVILFTFESMQKSIFIIAISSVITLLFINFAGFLKDKNNNLILYIAGLIQIISWMSYVFIDSIIGFIALGILISGSYKIINSAYEARLGYKLANGDSMDIKLSSNFSQILGRIFVLCILILTYSTFKTIPKEVLILGSVFIIPKVFFVLKSIQED